MYYFLYGIFYLLSLLPMAVLYVLSDIVFVIVYKLIGYRKDIVMNNLKMAFPEKTELELKKIRRDFYLNFTDNFIEMLKLFSASRKFIEKRFRLENPELFEKFFLQNRKCQVHLGHNFNWELANMGMPLNTSYHFIAVYMPLQNKVLDRIFLKLRSRTGSTMLPATKMRESILPYRDESYLLALVADQAPGSPENSYWLPFFGYPTPFVRGPERGARAGNVPVIFAYTYKVKRGYYRAIIELGAENPSQLEEGELTKRYILFLENCIRMHPSLYLWSHRRWKHSWKADYKNLWIGDPSQMPR